MGDTDFAVAHLSRQRSVTINQNFGRGKYPRIRTNREPRGWGKIFSQFHNVIFSKQLQSSTIVSENNKPSVFLKPTYVLCESKSRYQAMSLRIS